MIIKIQNKNIKVQDYILLNKLEMNELGTGMNWMRVIGIKTGLNTKITMMSGIIKRNNQSKGTVYRFDPCSTTDMVEAKEYETRVRKHIYEQKHKYGRKSYIDEEGNITYKKSYPQSI